MFPLNEITEIYLVSQFTLQVFQNIQPQHYIAQYISKAAIEHRMESWPEYSRRVCLNLKGEAYNTDIHVIRKNI